MNDSCFYQLTNDLNGVPKSGEYLNQQHEGWTGMPANRIDYSALPDDVLDYEYIVVLKTTEQLIDEETVYVITDRGYAPTSKIKS